MNDLYDLSLLEVSGQLQDGKVSAVELTRVLLDRIEALDPTLHCYAAVAPELALEQAAAAQAELGAGTVRGPLHGVPIALKDLCATPGLPTRAGAPAVGDWNPDGEATVARRLREAGACCSGSSS